MPTLEQEPEFQGTVEFWENYYQSQETPWDIGQAAPPFTSLLSQLPPGKLAVLGFGKGHDAALFGQAGFEVVGFDYAPSAVQEAQARYGSLASFHQSDIFALPNTYWGRFDYVLEHTCFCAILPEQRPAYVQAVRQLLKPNGMFIGLFWAHGREGGPPFTTDMTELKTLFSEAFTFESVTIPENSVESRRGKEYLCLLRRKN